jgi:hypothetical protein
MERQLKTIATFLAPEEAEIAQSALEAEGIAAYLEGASTVGMTWIFSNAVGGVKLQVVEADEQRARDILAEHPAVADTRASPGVCPKCGANLPPGFEVCWSCSSPMAGRDEPNAAEAAATLAEEACADDSMEVEAAGDHAAWRALVAAVLGIVLCPPLLSLYSMWVLLRLSFSRQPLSPRGTRNCYLALLANFVACLVLGPMLYILFRR